MPQKENGSFLRFLIITPLVLVCGVCIVCILVCGARIVRVLRDNCSGDPKPAIVVGNGSATSTVSSGWCDESEEGDCLPATCQAHMHTVVVFHADWCPWCRMLKRETLSDPAVINALKPFGKVSVDTEENSDTSAAYEVSGIPVIVVLDKDCKEVIRISGFVDAETLLEELDGL